MINGRVAESNKGTRQKVKIGHLIIQSIYNMFVFTATSHDDWIARIQKGLGYYFYTGTFLGLVTFKVALYCYDIVVSKNKNIGKFFSFLRELAAASLTITAAVGGFTTSVTLAVITPWLYISSMLINITFNFSIAMHNLCHWAISKDQEAKKRYRASFNKHIFNVAFVVTLTAALIMIMITPVIPTAMAILSACLNAITFVIGVKTAYQMYQAQKQSNKILQASPNANKIGLSDHTSTKKLQRQFDNEKIARLSNQTMSQNYNDDYYFHCNERAIIIVKLDEPKRYLLEQIKKKIVCLKLEICKDKHKLFSQETKRKIKITVLEKLRNLINNPRSTLKDFYALLNEPEFNNFFNNPFQSFFRQKSDTQDIFEAAEVYFWQFHANKGVIAQPQGCSLKYGVFA